LTLALGTWGIARGLIIEPPAFIANTINALIDAVTRRFAEPTVQAP
jgi:hypothetical protein